MANGIGYVNVIVGEEFKQEYDIALAKAGKKMKTHIVESMQELIDKHKQGGKKK